MFSSNKDYTPSLDVYGDMILIADMLDNRHSLIDDTSPISTISVTI